MKTIEPNQKTEATMRYPSRLLLSSVLLLSFLAIHASGQAPTEEYKISRVTLTFFPTDKHVDVRFTDNLDRRRQEDLMITNVTLNLLPSGAAITGTEVKRDPFNPRVLSITIAPGATRAASDTQIRACFTSLHFLDPARSPHIATAVCGTGDALTPENIADQLEKQYQVLEQTPKTSDEKNIFASGFTSKGKDADTEGGAEIHLNSNDLAVPGLTVAMHLNKTTADNADPKAFQAAITYRSTFLTDAAGGEATREQLAIIRNPNSTPEQRDAARNEINRLTKKRQDMLIGAWLLDIGANLEGEALNFKVTNFVGEGALQLQSRTKKLFGSKSGFWKFRLLAGVEGGKNLNIDTASMTMNPQLHDLNYIVRFKFGGALTLFYSNPDTRFLFKRIEGDARAVERYLFLDEVMFDETTKMNILTDKGRKPWFQADGKFFLADTPGGRLGFKISFSRGSLPPVFAQTNSFQFGFVVESADDTKK